MSSAPRRPAFHSRAALLELVTRRLEEANKAGQRLGQPESSDALHDLRVALRRFRVLASSYEVELEDVFRKKDLHALAKLQRATGAARDAEVAASWMERLSHGLRLGAADTRATAELTELLASEATHTDRLRHQLPRKVRPLLRQLRHASGRPANGAAFRGVVARATARASAELLSSMILLVADLQPGNLHRARLAAKRVRYLSEPLSDRPEAKAVVKQLRALQDLLGELNDLHVLSERLNGLKLGARSHLLRRLEHEQELRRRQLRRQWLFGTAFPSLVRTVAALVRALAS